MDTKNIELIERIAEELSGNNIRYRFIDERWKKRGDIDIIINKKDINLFEKILKKNGFKRKGFWPPQSRVYKVFLNNEIISIGGHVGGYIGGFGGGLGRIGKVLEPKSVKNSEDRYLTAEEQIFILIYKYGSRKKKSKYEEDYERLMNLNLNYDKLFKLCCLAFKNSKEIVNKTKEKAKLNEIKVKFKLNQKIALFFRGKPNKILKRVYKIFSPGLYIAFVGCNGTGKSTTMKNLAEKLEKENIEVAAIYSGRMQFQMLPINYFLKFFKPDKIEGKKKEDKNEYEREIRIFKNPLLNFVAPFVYYLEYLLRYVFKARIKRIFNDIVITDRSFIDVFSSPNMNKKVCKFLFKLMPNPKYILLWNDAKVIVKRRPEFLLKHVQEQIDAYNQLSSIYFMKVKTDRIDIVDDIAKKIEGVI